MIIYTILDISQYGTDWHLKKQSTIETSVFGAEFVAMKQGMEALQGL
jgi:hypothetical protein